MAYAEKRGKGEYPWRVKYKLPDGSETSESGFRTKQDALDHGRDKEADIRGGRWHDPKRGEILLDDYFWKTWLPAQRLSDKSKANHKGEYRAWIEPRFGQRKLNDLEPFEVRMFENELRDARSKSQADNVMDLLRFMCDDAVHAQLIPMSPVMPKQRRGMREPSTTRKGVAIDLPTLDRILGRLGRDDRLMVLVAAFTGMRWGEVIGIRRSFLELQAAKRGAPASGLYVIDPDIGAVHEDERGRRFYGPPKGRKGRTVELPPFLVLLLLAYLETFPADRDALFVGKRGALHNRSNFNDRHWRPACDGWAGQERSQGRPLILPAEPVVSGLHFHDLRHTHKTWLAEDDINPVARDERLGHATPGMDGRYIHATPTMRRVLLESLEHRWGEFQRDRQS